MFGVAFVLGPLIGGFLTEQVSWHWIFYVNIPIGIVSLIVIQRILPTVKTPRATRNFDFLGGVIFTIAIALLLIGLTNKGLVDDATKQLHMWTDPSVGGLILAGVVGILLFILAESRAKEPIIPLGLFRNRTYSSSMVSSFFAAFAFFGAIVFLPRWFQVVHDFSPTYSGLAALPLMIGLIFSSIVSGFLVSRTGRYKWLLVGAIVLIGRGDPVHDPAERRHPAGGRLAVDVPRRSRRRADVLGLHDRRPERRAVQRQLGVATSNLTFFRQIGGTVALAFVGTIFATSFQEQLSPQMVAAGVPPNVIGDFFAAVQAGKIDFNVLTGVGGVGQVIVGLVPSTAPVIEAVVQARNAAFSLAVSQTFWLGVAGSAVAAIAAAMMHEHALRTSNADAVPAHGATPAGGVRQVPAHNGAARAVSTTDRPVA